MKGLMRTQKIFKVFEVIFKILFILSIIATSFMLLALIGVIILPLDQINEIIIENLKNYGLTMDDINLSLKVMRTLCALIIASSLIPLGTSIALTYMTHKFFKEEQAIGTPFDYQVVKKMRKLGLIYIIVSVASSIGVGIILGVIYALISVTNLNVSISTSSTLGFGIVLLLVSCLLEYGADLRSINMKESQEKEEKGTTTSNYDE